MSTNRIEAANGAGKKEEGKSPAGNGSGNAEAKTAEAVPAAASGFKAWIPLLANVVLMPAIAYATTAFVLAPMLKKSLNESGGSSSSEHGKPKSGGHEKGEGSKEVSGKVAVPLSSKVLVNLAGSGGSRYLLANITLVGSGGEFKDRVEKGDAQLRDVAASALCNKTIGDLEKPGARNLIRSELISAFNAVLGDASVGEIYLTEFAIQ